MLQARVVICEYYIKNILKYMREREVFLEPSSSFKCQPVLKQFHLDNYLGRHFSFLYMVHFEVLTNFGPFSHRKLFRPMFLFVEFSFEIEYFVAMFTISLICRRQKSNINFLGQRPLNYLLHISILKSISPAFYLQT